ncbi:hypothetical protein L6164_031965 [Bauhinia variegata]|uniref:Uncharacterized protein n=1 Tax=Bauhinia variegata TaxID=167791 RepID=A0ACB9KM56_BAUVA|nr:hypothetical protein L6164_031965 [Bauhinia variegata]
MASLLKKLRRGVPSVPENENDNSVECSFALEYSGPPLSYSIPEVAPFKIDQIPVAVVAHSPASQLYVPVIQPIVKSSHAKTKLKLARDSDSFHSINSESSEAEFARLRSSGSSSNHHSLSVDSSNRKHSSGPLASAGECAGNLSMRIPTSHEIIEVSGALELPDEDRDFQNGMKSTNSDTRESSSSSLSDSSEISSCGEDDRENDNDTPKHVKRPSVTFRDRESNDLAVNNEFDDSQSGSILVRERAERFGKKGTCYRCLKGNRFTEKEICIVCSAKYCRKCVLKAMGTMPHGRKCLTCINHRIDENNRRILGKCSRMLKGLLSESEIRQIMRSEMFCRENQLASELILVNGEPLSRKQLVSLMNCPSPPKKLKQGSYWYDRASGFWGKEGHKPCQIISHLLEVGGKLRQNASNGNTKIFINDREITKAELWMLKIAEVPCEGTSHFWVSEDGSYQEVGQKNIRGRPPLWSKTSTRIVCAMLSLPVPSKSMTNNSNDLSGKGANRVAPGCLEQKGLYKLLLVGSTKSGTSTVFKQAKILYNVPFSESERQNMKLVIQSNLYIYLGILLEGREQFEEENLLKQRKRQLVDESTSSGNAGKTEVATIYSLGPRLKAFSDFLIECMVSGNVDTIVLAATREYAPLVEELWRDAAIQATCNRRNELEMLPRGASYFLDRAVEISKVDYEPSDMDILYAEGITLSNSITSMEFSFGKSDGEDCLGPEYQHDPSLRYQLIRVHPRSLGENCKRLEMFEDTNVVLFCVALTDYGEYTVDSCGVSTNKMMATKKLFENIITHATFSNKNFVLIMTKFDLLEEKIELVPLKRCEWFSDFNPVISHNPNRGVNFSNNNPPLAHRAFQYIAVKFKKLFLSLTERKLFVSLVTGLEPDTVDEALRYAREVMLWKKPGPPSVTEQSSTMDETSILHSSTL